MRTNIEVDDALIKEAQELSGLKTKRAVVDAALRMFVRVQHQKDILKLPGKVEFWDEVVRDRDENRLNR
jgi:Arc/MetJ family transcription regulator